MSSRSHHSHSLLGLHHRWLSHDYIARHRRIRAIFTVVLIALLSLLLAAMIVYTSNPGGFPVTGR